VQILQYKPSHEDLPLMRDMLQASDRPLLDPGSIRTPRSSAAGRP
jgi:hypothetical protein